MSKNIVEPSPELISDEYDLHENKSGAVHIFCTDVNLHDKINPDTIVKIFEKFQCKVLDKNIHYVRTFNEVADILVDRIYNHTQNDTHNFLILFFIGKINEAGSDYILDEKLPISEIFTFFYGHVTSHLKNIPKIFMFHGFTALENTTQTDSGNNSGILYEKPPEADILIAFKRYTELSEFNECLEQLESNVSKYLKSKDIIRLLSHVQNPPLIISTLTKKFYLVGSENRGIEFDIESKNISIERCFQDIENLETAGKQIFLQVPVDTTDSRRKKRLQTKSESDNAASGKSIRKQSVPNLPASTETRSRTNSINKKKPWK